MRSPTAFLLLLVTAIAVTVLAGSAFATGVPPGITVLGSGFTGEPFSLGGDIVLESYDTVDIIRDYALPPQPAISGWLDHGATGWWRQLVRDGSLGVAVRDPRNTSISGFCVLDLGDPYAPVTIGELTGMEFDSAWLRGTAATLSSGTLLVTYDLAQPAQPAFTAANLVGDAEGSRWFSAVGNTLYFIDHAAELGALVVTDPAHPALQALFGLPGDRLDALVAGDDVLYALVSSGDRLDLVTLDAGTPAQPVVVAQQILATGSGLRGLALVCDGQLLLASATDGVVRSFGLADPWAPAPGWTLAHRGDRLALSASRAFVRDGADLYVYERTAFDTAPPAPLVRSDLPEFATYGGRGPVLVGQLSGATYDLATIDVSDPSAPRAGAPFDLGTRGHLAYADGIGAMLEGDRTCRLLDLRDPLQPALLGAVAIPGDSYFTYDLLSPRLLYLTMDGAATEAGMCDVSDPLHPGPLLPVPDYSPRLATDRYLFCGELENLRIWDIGDPGAPVLRGTLDFPGRGAGLVQVRGDHAYVVTSLNGYDPDLRAYDFSDPAAPVQVAVLPHITGARRLDLHGNRLYASGFRGFSVYDLADPDDPQLLSRIETPANANSGFGTCGNVSFVSGWLLAVRNDGLSPASAPRPDARAAIALSPAWPNPCNPATTLSFAVDAERELALAVYDIRGRHVVDVAQGRFAAGTHQATWNGTDAAGAPVAAGVYLLRLHGPGVEAATTVTLVK